MYNLKYEDLTKGQKYFVANGCGGKGGIIKPPNFIFLASCGHHDFRYWRGGTKSQRQRDDEAFYLWMKEDIKNAKWYLKPHYHIWAYTYYKSVRLGGGKYYHFADKQKNLKDLIAEMENKK